MWFQSFGGYLYESSYLCLDSIGNAYIGNSFLENGGVSYQILKYSNSGQQLWRTAYPSIPTEIVQNYLRCIDIDNHGNVYVSGLKEGGARYDDFLTLRINSITGLIQDQNNIPLKFSLIQNYPNPFNPTTVIRYSIPDGTGRDLSVHLKVYDLNGKEVALLVNDKQSAGSYSVEFDGSKFASGIYFYTLSAGEFKETRKMFLVK